MASPRFQHGFEHDVFISYTHADNQPDRTGRRWVESLETDLKVRLEQVSGHSIDTWRDSKLGAADRFNDAIERELKSSAVLLTVLSPSYFRSEYCRRERDRFNAEAEAKHLRYVGDKARVVKAAKTFVPREQYPADLRELLERRFYVEIPGTSQYREFHLAEDQTVRDRYDARVDDVAQDIAAVLSALEPSPAVAATKGTVYLAETTSDLEPKRDELRRGLDQAGYEVVPREELRLLRADEVRRSVVESLSKCRLAVHPVGAYFGMVPEGAGGKSLTEIQLETAAQDARNGNLGRIIWIPEGIQPKEDAQLRLIERLRTDYSKRGFEILERPFPALAEHLKDRLNPPPSVVAPNRTPRGVYLICDNSDRAVAKNVRLLLFSQKFEVEWTPLSLNASQLGDNPQHLKLLERNGAHLVVVGNASDGWLQDRIRELADRGAEAPQAIYLADPPRDDKQEILVRGIELLQGYAPVPPAEALQPFIRRLTAAGLGPATGPASATAGGWQ